MRFVVLRYGGTSSGPAGGTPLLDDLTAVGGRRVHDGVPSSHDADHTDPHAHEEDARSDDTAVAAALAGLLAPPRAPRDDLAALAAVLGVTTVLDETLGSPDIATTVRSRAEGLSLTDGTATAPDGPLVGLHVLDAPDLDALVDVLTLLPAGTFEVHPVVAA